ncbi:MAG: arylsulfatase [Pirellulales bacterium]
MQMFFGRILSTLILGLVVAVSWCEGADRPPNIVFIIADDLGYGDLGCYGQTKIRTPSLDLLAKSGMRFTQHYSGSNVCAPSRCVLMTGKHTGHCFIRENRQAKGYDEGQEPVPAGSLTLLQMLKKLGYTLGGFGKWGLGPMGSSGDPLKQGFDRWYGFNCQAVAHNHYPTHLWDNDQQVALNNPRFAAHQKFPESADPNSPASYEAYRGKDFAGDLIGAQALEFVKANQNRPFFLFYPTTTPHLALQVPEDSLKEYVGKFEDEPYLGNKGYLPHKHPRAAYAAMISRMDAEVGKLLSLLEELKLSENTIVIFTSDNGPLYDRLGGTDADFFNSAGGLRGRKGSFYEGGYRVPCIVRWPGKVEAGSVSTRVTGFEDWLPTLMEMAGRTGKLPVECDGISFVATLQGKEQPQRPFLYRESPGYGGQQAVRMGNWKGIRRNLNPGAKAKETAPGKLELYDLSQDPNEQKDLAEEHPEIVARILELMQKEHEPSEEFPLRAIDRKG